MFLLVLILMPLGWTDCLSNNVIESCVIDFSCPGSKFVIFAIYRPHSGNHEKFISVLIDLLNDTLLHGKKIILLGDFNINILDDDSNTVQLLINELHA